MAERLLVRNLVGLTQELCSRPPAAAPALVLLQTLPGEKEENKEMRGVSENNEPLPIPTDGVHRSRNIERPPAQLAPSPMITLKGYFADRLYSN